MAYVMSSKRRGDQQKAADMGYVPVRSEHGGPGAILTKDGVTRVCDNRLRAIRVWLHDGEQMADMRCAFLIKDLKITITKARLQGLIDSDWLSKLEDLVNKIDVSDLEFSFALVYSHLGKSYPRGILAYPSDSWSRDQRRRTPDPNTLVEYVPRNWR